MQNNTAEAGQIASLHICRQCSTLGAGERFASLTRRFLKSQGTPAPEERPNWLVAARAAESKKANDLRVLDVGEVTSFTDYFVICSSANPRHGHAICDEIAKQLKQTGELPISIEGYAAAEWILMDYGDFIVHIFSEAARAYYELERLWRHAKAVNSGADDRFVSSA
jgi:ribosome-associated protein